MSGIFRFVPVTQPTKWMVEVRLGLGFRVRVKVRVKV